MGYQVVESRPSWLRATVISEVTNLIGELFITPHAIEQFQKRIARLGDEQAREVIRAGVRQAANLRVLPDGETLYGQTVSL